MAAGFCTIDTRSSSFGGRVYMINNSRGLLPKYFTNEYLNPDATRTYLKIIFETYEKLVGDEFGKTILGFRGDEPDYTGFMSWTPKLFETFQKEKGYDLQPYIAQFFTNELTAEAKRVKADYWDVWSGLFRDNFFKPMQDWCRARKMDYVVLFCSGVAAIVLDFS